MLHNAPVKIPPTLKLAGLLLLLSGWMIVVSAFILLQHLPARIGFVLAGMVVELLGLGVVVYSHGFVRRSKT